jgi:hypothetical protein
VAIVSQWQSASDEDWALALAREAVIRLLTDQPEVTEELVVTASASLVSLEVWSTGSSQNSRRQRPGSRIGAVSRYWRFLLMIILARQLNSRESGLSTI